MTFFSAYCEEFGRITALKAKTEYERTGTKLLFSCPDRSCGTELIGVNIYTDSKFKHKPHFRTRKGCSHSPKCFVVKEIEREDKEKNNVIKAGGYNHISNHPDVFKFVERSESEERTSRAVQSQEDEQTQENGYRRTTFTSKEPTDNKKAFETSSLENIVDIFESLCEENRKAKTIIMFEKTRS